jgi:hypothetical protein
MEVSRTSINAARATVAAITHGFTRGFQAADTLGAGLVIVIARGAVLAVDTAVESAKNLSRAFIFDACVCFFD